MFTVCVDRTADAPISYIFRCTTSFHTESPGLLTMPHSDLTPFTLHPPRGLQGLCTASGSTYHHSWRYCRWSLHALDDPPELHMC